VSRPSALGPEGSIIICPCCGLKGRKASRHALREECAQKKKRIYNTAYKKAKRPDNERKDELAANWRAKQPWAYDLSAKFLKELKL